MEITTQFTPWTSLAGGILIGLSATLLMWLHGRIAGMTGLWGGLVPPLASDWQLKATFLAGAIVMPFLFTSAGGTIAFQNIVPTFWLVAGGIIVGIGVSLGSGCTSGHGVCGMARFSTRSIVATITFMATSFLTVFVIRHLLGA